MIQKTSADLGGKIIDKEMFKTFNMGWGFALIVDKKDKDHAMGILGKAGAITDEIGHITRSEGIRILYKSQRIKLNENLLG